MAVALNDHTRRHSSLLASMNVQGPKISCRRLSPHAHFVSPLESLRPFRVLILSSQQDLRYAILLEGSSKNFLYKELARKQTTYEIRFINTIPMAHLHFIVNPALRLSSRLPRPPTSRAIAVHASIPQKPRHVKPIPNTKDSATHF